ncbi:hypothetical protein [Solilutibacter tolerans]|uniref:hypothetical protein n=1 Tax=Solilutibacter tolerans TaxID=1604334 RepID=UPI00097124AD|nr:hypothetical protein [Lysobacter tolerans]
MKTVAFVIGFLSVTVLSVPRIAAPDPEPIGAGASLYMLGFLLIIICTAAFAGSSYRRRISLGWLVGALTGAMSSGAFFGSIACGVAVFSLGILIAAGAIAALLISWVVPRFFRALPNNSFKPTPLRGAA